MTLTGTGRAHGALTVVNAIPTGKGAAVGIDLQLTASVELEPEPGPVELTVGAEEDVDPSLARACVETLAEDRGQPLSGKVRTDSGIPIARGLKSSSVAANAIVLALLDALEEEPEPREVLELSVRAAREAGVTVTGALDDAAASLLGGLVVTDNREDRVLRREPLKREHRVLLLVPQDRQPTSETGSLEDARPVAERSLDLVDADRWLEALTLNGLGVAACLGQGLDPAYRALAAGAQAAGTTGTGPAVGAIADPEATASIRGAWQPYTTGILQASTTNEGLAWEVGA